MLDAGLAGFELGHRENREPAHTTLRELCRERDLIVTGSSDYHGLGKPNQPGENTTDRRDGRAHHRAGDRKRPRLPVRADRGVSRS